MSDAADNLDELRAALRADAAGVAEALLGLPIKAAGSRKKLRFGSKGGSLIVEVSGDKKGIWYDWSDREGGDLLDLIRRERSCDFSDAVAWASRWTGIAVASVANDDDAAAQQRRAQQEADRQARLTEQKAKASAEEAAEQAQRIDVAQRIAKATVPAFGTSAAFYLEFTRGIPPGPDGWPNAIRFHSGHRAFVAVATDASGAVRAVQRIHLTKQDTKIDQAEVERRKLPAVKVTNGTLADAAVRLPGPADGPLLLCEGPETALATWSCARYETWAALGGIANLVPPAGRQIVVCRDDDKRHSPADKKLRRTLAEWRQAGIAVTVATPWGIRRGDGSDFADVILTDGVEAVRKRISAVLAPSRTLVERVPVKEARRQVAKAVGQFFGRVDQLSAERVNQADEANPASFTSGIRVSVGVGKSSQARVAVVSTLVAMRSRGDLRNIVLTVPTHVLGDEQAADFRAMFKGQAAGLRVAIWRGRDTPDPAYPEYRNAYIERDQKPKMCGDMERVKDAQSLGLSAQTAACKRRIKMPDGTKQTVMCPLFSDCSYQKQSELEADIWIMSHDLLFHEKPAAMGKLAAVVVDEAAWKKGYMGAEGKHLTLSVDALREDGGCPRLNDLRRQLLDASQLCGIGPVPATTLKYAGFDADGAAEAIKLEYARKVDPLHPGQTRQERKDAMGKAAGNVTISRTVMAWNAAREMLTPGGPEISGWLELAVEPTENGPVRVMRLKGRKKVSDGFKAPTLLLDALLEPDLVRPFWPDFEMVADVQADMPHQRVRQVIDRAYSLAMLEPLSAEAEKADPQEAARRANRLRDLRALLVREARRYAPEVVLVAMQKAIEKAMHDLGPLPGNVATAHHNAMAGIDIWKDVRALLVVGRTMPPPNGAERIAEALSGRATPAPIPWYQRTDCVREMADGSTIPAEADRHSDPLAELVRWQIAEGEVVQIIGRPRGVNRTAANPVDVLVLTDVPLPMPLAGTVEAAELEPNTVDLMLAAGGMVIENARHMATAYADLWTTHKAAAKALERERTSPFSYRDSYIGKRGSPLAGGSQLVQVSYQVAGAGQKPATAWCDSGLCPNPEAFLTAALAKLGPLAWCKVEEPPPEPDPSAVLADNGLSSGIADTPSRAPDMPVYVGTMPRIIQDVAAPPPKLVNIAASHALPLP